MTPGRSCPPQYRYAPADVGRAVAFETSCLYVVGGLYGNALALDSILELARQEPEPPAIVFNGDFNWFNVDDPGFAAINSRVLAHTALRGNVETEVAGDDNAAGCGCGYPDFVSDADVERSNLIIEHLRDTARRQPLLRRQLAPLPMYLTAAVGASRVAIVHGDCESLAGWGLSRESLAVPDHRARVTGWFSAARVNIIASSHSCLPILRAVAREGVTGLVANNGAAGMPNFRNSHYGIITRIAVRPSPHAALYGTTVNDCHVDALPVHYDQRRWLAAFLANWPAGSPAHDSYFRRVVAGPDYGTDDACRYQVSATPALRPIAV